MKKLTLAIILLGLCAAPAFGGTIILSDIAASIAGSAGDQARVDARAWQSATLYGEFDAASTIRVGLYVSVDGDYWAPMLVNVAAGDSAFTYTTTAGQKLNVVLPLMREVKASAAWSRVLYPLQLPRVKVVVSNTGVGALATGKWWIAYN